MLTINVKQIEALARAQRTEFIVRLTAHLVSRFPNRFGRLKPEAQVAAIEEAMTRAQAHKLETERDICLYTEVMILLGRDFETNPGTAELADKLRQTPDPFEGIDPILEVNKQAWALARAREAGANTA